MSEKKTKLKPCPFCGVTSVGFCEYRSLSGGKGLYAVVCARCGGRGGKQPSDKLAMKIWNERTHEKQEDLPQFVRGFTEEEVRGIEKGRMVR